MTRMHLGMPFFYNIWYLAKKNQPLYVLSHTCLLGVVFYRKVPLEACMHTAPEDTTQRGSQWPEQWPARLEKPPFWLSSSQTGVYGKAAPDDFSADYEHWKRVVTKSYLNGLGINWAFVRNVMDMKAVYGG